MNAASSPPGDALAGGGNDGVQRGWHDRLIIIRKQHNSGRFAQGSMRSPHATLHKGRLERVVPSTNRADQSCRPLTFAIHSPMLRAWRSLGGNASSTTSFRALWQKRDTPLRLKRSRKPWG